MRVPQNHDSEHTPQPPAPVIRFPGEAAADQPTIEISRREKFALAGLPESSTQVFDAIEDMSRRIDVLARELRCLGYFDDDDDTPRAA